MKKLLVMMLAGCNGNGESVEDGQSTEDASVATSEEVVSEETSDSETAEPEVSEEVSEMTLEEKILAEMLDGSGLAALQYIVAGMIVDEFIEYDTELYATGISSETVTKIGDIVREHYDK